MADDLASATFDLSLLSSADRRAILAALQPDERRRVEAVMRGAPPAAPATGSLHSPWFEGLPDSSRTTAAARAALAAASDPAVAGEAPRPSGRSLMQAAGGLFGHAGLRR